MAHKGTKILMQPFPLIQFRHYILPSKYMSSHYKSVLSLADIPPVGKCILDDISGALWDYKESAITWKVATLIRNSAEMVDATQRSEESKAAWIDATIKADTADLQRKVKMDVVLNMVKDNRDVIIGFRSSTIEERLDLIHYLCDKVNKINAVVETILPTEGASLTKASSGAGYLGGGKQSLSG